MKPRASFWMLACIAILLPCAAVADEIVETTDGRQIRLRSDGIYEFLSRLDLAVLDAAVAAAKQWAQDQTLVAFCLRGQPERELVLRNFPKDRDDALARLRRAGATEQELRQVATVMAENFKTSGSGADDKKLDEACTTRKVAEQVFALSGVGVPLTMRPPFAAMK